jgi:hypothetical protein
MSTLHILRTTGHYIGQVRGIGCRNWRTVTGRCREPTKALSKAVTCMGDRDKRARALYVPTGDTGSYYGPSLAMEARRA